MVRFRWPDDDGDLEVTLHFAEGEGRGECIGVDLRTFRWAGDPYPPRKLPGSEPRPLTTADLRGLRLGELVERGRASVFRALTEPSRDAEWDEAPWAAGQLEPWQPRGRGRPPLYGPEHFAEVARVYRDAFARGRKPTRAVAQRFSVTQATAAKWVARSRQMGYLPPTARGRARAAAPRKPAARRRRER